MTNSAADLRAAIAELQAKRAELGGQVVDLAIAPLRAQLDALSGRGGDHQRLKQVTVLFSDVVGSTDMARQLDPEDVHAVMDGALLALTDVIEAFRGRVLQYAGDSVLAVFGAQSSSEADPENAVQAGLAMLAKVKEYAIDVHNRFGVDDFQIRAGAHTGRVLLGGGVDADNSIRGITVNIAARMEQSAPPGGLRISYETYRHIRGVFHVEAQAPVAVKGLVDPVASYLVYGVRDRPLRSRSRSIDGVATAMIGRQCELEQICEALFAIRRAEVNRVKPIIVCGAAGVGKSRLIDEFQAMVGSDDDAPVLLTGRAQVDTQTQPYGLLRDLIARLVRVTQGDTRASSREKFCTFMTALFAPSEVTEFEFLGHLIGLDFSASEHLAGVVDDPAQIRRRGFNAATRVLQALVAQAPGGVVIVLEDIHWADSDTLNWLTHLMDANDAPNCLLLALARPELFDLQTRWRDNADLTRIDLQALDQTHRQQLATHLLARLSSPPETLIRFLVRRADGNPFYMEELVKMLLDDGAIRSDLDGWHLVDDKLRLDSVPATLTGVLQARLDRLGADQQRLLRQASVVGFVFWDLALEDCSAADLEALVQREIIVPSAKSRLAGAREFSFHHHLLHQVTYESVLKARKQDYHLRAAKWFEQRGDQLGSEFQGDIARHYERGGDTSNALDAYARAAEDAAARHACDAALRYVSCAMPLLKGDNHELQWRLLLAREKILATLEDRDAHDADLAALDATARALGDPRRRVLAVHLLAVARMNIGDYALGIELCEQAREIASTGGVEDLVAQIIATHAFCLRRMGDFSGAKRLATRGIELARQRGDLVAEGELLTNLAGLASETGGPAQAIPLIEDYLAITRRLGDKVREANALNRLGDGAFRLGAYRQARDWFLESQALARSIGSRYGECITLLNLALVSNLQGHYESALTDAIASVQIAVHSGSRDLEAAASLQQGIAEMELSRFDDGVASLERSRDVFLQNDGEHLAMEPIAMLAGLSLRGANVAEAMRYANQVIAHLESGGTIDGTEEPLRIRWHCYEALTASKDPRARDWLLESWEMLQQRAQMIPVERQREAFVKEVPHHAAIRRAFMAR